MATADDVAWCYRNLLGREPESVEAMERHAREHSDLRSLVRTFVNSVEFRRKKSPPPLVALDHSIPEVEVSATPEQLARLAEGVREAWTHMGSVRPHHSVLSSNDYLPENLSDVTMERFWASGRHEVQSTINILQRHGFGSVQGKVCVEYGCGLGRVTFALAGGFQQVHAYDISATHLTRARRYAVDKEFNNVNFHLSSPQIIDEEIERCDCFYSRIVFQHNPPPLAHVLIKRALLSLRPAGMAIFQVPTYGSGYRFSIDDYLARPRKLDMEMHCVPQPAIFKLITQAGCDVCEVREDGSIGRFGEWISNTFVVRRPRAG